MSSLPKKLLLRAGFTAVASLLSTQVFAHCGYIHAPGMDGKVRWALEDGHPLDKVLKELTDNGIRIKTKFLTTNDSFEEAAKKCPISLTKKLNKKGVPQIDQDSLIVTKGTGDYSGQWMLTGVVNGKKIGHSGNKPVRIGGFKLVR